MVSSTDGRDLDAPIVLHQKEQRVLRVIIEAAKHTDLVHEVRLICTARPNANFAGFFTLIFHGVDAQQFKLIGITADCRFLGQVGVNGARAAYSTGDGERTARNGLGQHRSTGAGICIFFPAHNDFPPNLMVTVS